MLACASESWGGYPFRFEFDCSSPVVSLASGLQVNSGNVLVVALAYNPSHLIALIDGPTAIDGLRGERRQFTHGRITASLRVQGGGEATASVELPGFSAEGVGSWNLIVAHARTAPEASIDIAMTANGLHIDTEADEDLVIDEGVLTGRIDATRVLDIEKVDLRRNQTSYSGKGTIGLDASRRLDGKLSTETNDLMGLLDILEPHLKMTDQERANLRMLMGLLGQTAKFDLAARDGALFVGPLKVTDLLPLY